MGASGNNAVTGLSARSTRGELRPRYGVSPGRGCLTDPYCQEEPYDPGRDVSINPNQNPILTP